MQPDDQTNARQGNIWPNKFPPRIDESNYNYYMFMILLKVLVMSISGITFLLLSLGLFLWSIVCGGNKSNL